MTREEGVTRIVCAMLGRNRLRIRGNRDLIVKAAINTFDEIQKQLNEERAPEEKVKVKKRGWSLWI